MMTPTTKSAGTGGGTVVAIGAGVDVALPTPGVDVLRLLVVLDGTQPMAVTATVAPIRLATNDFEMCCHVVP
jgi:hypothetical protein